MSKLPGKIDAEAILQTLAGVRKSIPFELSPLPPDGGVSATPMSGTETIEDFELATVAEGLDRLLAELSEGLDRAHAKVLSGALRVYYATEELARDPANAHLIPHLEEMRRAYERDYGVPIPAKG